MILLFDLGGVFVPDSTDVLNREVAEYIGIPVEELVRRWTGALPPLFTGKMTIQEFYGSFRHAQPDSGLVLAKHLSVYRKLFCVDPAMAALLKRLQQRHVTACLTNTELEIAGMNREAGLYGLFHHAFLSTEMGMRKPEARIFQAAMRKLDASPDNVLLIDDKAENIEAAHAVGMRTALFTGRRELEAQLHGLGVDP